MVGAASCGLAAGAGSVFEAIKKGVKQKKIKAQIKKTGCIGLCHLEPLVDIIVPGKPRLTYGKVTTRTIPGMLNALKQGKVPGGALGRIEKEDFFLENTCKSYTEGTDDQSVSSVPLYDDMPFYQKQSRIALRNCGFIDPEDILEYIAKGGYLTLARTLEKKSPGQVASEVERSGEKLSPTAS